MRRPVLLCGALQGMLQFGDRDGRGGRARAGAGLVGRHTLSSSHPRWRPGPRSRPDRRGCRRRRPCRALGSWGGKGSATGRAGRFGHGARTRGASSPRAPRPDQFVVGEVAHSVEVPPLGPGLRRCQPMSPASRARPARPSSRPGPLVPPPGQALRWRSLSEHRARLRPCKRSSSARRSSSQA